MSGEFDQYTLLAQLTDVEAQSKLLDDAMVINEPTKPVASSSRHPNNEDIVDSELRYYSRQQNRSDVWEFWIVH